MHIKPKVWTHHHTQRLYHISMLATWVFISVVVTSGIFVAMNQAGADTIIRDDSVSAVIPGVDTSTSTPVTEPSVGGGPVFPAPIINPYITVQLKNSSQHDVVLDGKKTSLYVINSKELLFFGETNIPNANIFLEVFSLEFIHGSVKTDAQGKWSWQVPLDLSEGFHTIYVTAQDPNYANINAYTHLDFLINFKPSIAVPVTSVPLPAGQLKFNVTLTVPEKYKTTYPGQEVRANVEVLNFGSKNLSEPAPLHFIVRDPEGSVVLDTEETINTTDRTIVSKPFFIRPTAVSGRYTISVSLQKGQTIAFGRDSFDVKSRALVALTASWVVDYTLIFQVLLVLLFLFLLVSYLEYNKVVILSRYIKQLTERDLKGEI